MIIQRIFWKKLIEIAWQHRNVVWLMGVRRAGKTSLCKSLEGIEFFDCELPSVRQELVNPEAFLNKQRGKRIAIDEIHRLDNPSELLKIAADYFPDIKIVATGSSTLGASAKFSDTLTGRKREVWLTPMLLNEMEIFGSCEIKHRFLFGGFPSFFVQKKIIESDFDEWIDAYWAKDIQELFSINKRSSFLKFAELLLVNSGGMFEAMKYSVACEISRETIANYLQVLEETFVVHVIRPYSTHKTTEIVKAPKVYGFDTGFVAHVKGWGELRQEDMGFMWEHIVLNEMHGNLQMRKIHYWRDKHDHDIDFLIPHRSRENKITAIECKFTIISDEVNVKAIARNFLAFRQLYPEGENFVIAYNIAESFIKNYQNIEIHFVSLKDMINKLEKIKNYGASN